VSARTKSNGIEGIKNWKMGQEWQLSQSMVKDEPGKLVKLGQCAL
jgi:hypothetical protein